MKYLVDSDLVAEYLKGRTAAIDLIQRLTTDGIAISVITLAEIYEGIYYGTNPIRQEQGLNSFLQGVSVLDVDMDVARRYAIIRGDLRKQGMLIPQPDLLIAATAIDVGLVLATRNIATFVVLPD